MQEISNKSGLAGSGGIIRPGGGGSRSPRHLVSASDDFGSFRSQQQVFEDTRV